jgi:hypothetical protein
MPAGKIRVNGTEINEPYVYQDVPFEAGVIDCSTAVRSPRCFAAIQLGDDQYLVMGDNRVQFGGLSVGLSHSIRENGLLQHRHAGGPSGPCGLGSFPSRQMGSWRFSDGSLRAMTGTQPSLLF